MRFLFSLLIIGAAAWAGYWFVGAGVARSALEAWFDARQAEGWQAEYDALDIAGFPNRFDAGFTNIALADPETGLAWRADFFQILALSYRPNHVIAVWPHEMRLATPGQKYDLRSDDMRASVVFESSAALKLDRATMTAESLAIMPHDQPALLRVKRLTLAVQKVPTDDRPNYHFGLEARGFAPPRDWQEQVDPDGYLPDRFQALRADLEVTFDKPWNRSAIESARPQPREIHLKLAEARWGEVSLKAAGDLVIDKAGYPEGAITIEAQNWREILQMLRGSGQLDIALIDSVEDGLGLIARLADDPKSLEIPLEFSSRRIWLGPLPLGPAPVFRLR